ncbi:MAG: substrate-binding domain-containing protein [Hydrotalea sp.]|nr:substrate-binding domain-containing protein [Hydrotalea sp.]
MKKNISNALRYLAFIFLAWAMVAGTTPAQARDYLLLQTTSSVQDSGLLDFLLPQFTKDTGIKVHAVSLGSGVALASAARGEADIAITHSPKLEKQYEEQGYFSKRKKLFWNDFIIVGPPFVADKFLSVKTAPAAFKLIAKNKFLFFSRADKSGTHSKELEIWDKANLNPKTFDKSWYKELGQPMGKTLQSAIAVNAIALCDLATFAKSNVKDYVVLFKKKDLGHEKPDSLLKNDYSIILIDKNKFPNLEHEKAKAFFEWMYNKDGTGRGQTLATQYRINDKQVFFKY